MKSLANRDATFEPFVQHLEFHRKVASSGRSRKQQLDGTDVRSGMRCSFFVVADQTAVELLLCC